jgi:hypothetical protein
VRRHWMGGMREVDTELDPYFRGDDASGHFVTRSVT